MARERTQLEIDAANARAVVRSNTVAVLISDKDAATASALATFESQIALAHEELAALTVPALDALRASEILHADGSDLARETAREVYAAAVAPFRAAYVTAAAKALADYEAAIAADVAALNAAIKTLLVDEERTAAAVSALAEPEG